MDPVLIPLIAVAVVVLCVSLTDWLSVPLGIIVAATVAVSEPTVWEAAAAAAAGVVLGRWLVALEARARRREALPGAADTASSSLRSFLAAHPAYAQITFLLGLVPVLPPRMLWKVTGSLGAPKLWLAIGTFVSQLLLISLTATLWGWFAGLFTDTDDELAGLLAAIGIALALSALLRRVDWAHRRATGKWRLRSDAGTEQRVSFVTGRLGDGPPRSGGFADDSWSRHVLDLDDSAIHATVDDEDEAEAEDLPELQSEFPDSDDDSPADGRDGPGAS